MSPEIEFFVRRGNLKMKSGCTGHKKGRSDEPTCLKNQPTNESNIRLGLAQTLNAVPRFPLTALLEQIDPLKAFQDVALQDDTGGALEAIVL